MRRDDLDLSVPDERDWVRENRVYCPIPWCRAHKFRGVVCGDEEGDYEGIHVARILAVAREERRVAQEIEALREMGDENPLLTYGFLRMMQDAVDQGQLKGRRGRRRLVPR